VKVSVDFDLFLHKTDELVDWDLVEKVVSFAFCT